MTPSHEAPAEPRDHENAETEFTIGVARFMMETCTFSGRPTGIAEWEDDGPPLRGNAVLESSDYIRGFD